MTTDRRLERLRAALEASATEPKGKTKAKRSKAGEPLGELWEIARSGESESARVSALRLLLAHEERPADAAEDSRALLKRIASDPSVAGSHRLKALEKVLADETAEREAAERERLDDPEVAAEADAMFCAMVLVEAASPVPTSMPRLHALLGQLRHAWTSERAPSEPPRVRELGREPERAAEAEPEPPGGAPEEPEPERGSEPKEPPAIPEGIDPRAGWEPEGPGYRWG